MWRTSVLCGLSGLFMLCAACNSRQKAWEEAKQRDSIAGYEELLRNYPDHPESHSAKQRIEELRRPVDWQEAATANTVEAYGGFLKQHPEGTEAQEARRRLDRLLLPGDFKVAKASRTVEGYITFLEKHPQGAEAKEILGLLEPLLYRKAVEERSLEACEHYLNYFKKTTKAQRVSEVYEPLKHYHDTIDFIVEHDPDYRFEADELRLLGTYRLDARAFVATVACLDPDRAIRYLEDPLNRMKLESRGGFDDTYIMIADENESYLLSQIQKGRIESRDVYYFVKTGQMLMTHLAEYSLSMTIRKKFLKFSGEQLERDVRDYTYGSKPHSDEDVERLKAREGHYQDAAQEYNQELDALRRALEVFNRRTKPFAGLLPVQELSRYSHYDYSLESADKLKAALEAALRTVDIGVLTHALDLVRTGHARTGLELLDAVGQVKIAFLGMLLTGSGDDYLDRQKVTSLQRDVEDYYAFVQGYVDSQDVAVRKQLPRGLENRLADYRMGAGIFNSGLEYKLSSFWSPASALDLARFLGNQP